MDGLQLRDELVRDRIRQAEEFLDPSTSRVSPLVSCVLTPLSRCASTQLPGGHRLDAQSEAKATDS